MPTNIVFIDVDKEHIGRADIIRLATIEDDYISEIIGRPGFDVYFLIQLTFSSDSEYFIDEIPTGIPNLPEISSPNEYILTDGDEIWYAARYRNSEKPDKSLYLLDEFPERMQHLTQYDKAHIIGKIKLYCDKLQKEIDGT